MVMGGFEAHLLTSFHEAILKVQDALARAQARFELVGIERLDKVIVGAGFQTSDDVFFRFARGEQDHVHVAVVPAFAYLLANTRAIELGHHPVEQDQTRGVRLTQALDRLPTVGDRRDFVTGKRESFLQQPAGQGIIVSN
jgi:hypothetical protein